MNYYLDTEFLEGTQTKRILGIPYGKTKPTIDLISIGIVSEDNREYYAISSDFNLKEAWNRFEWRDTTTNKTGGEADFKYYWIRENVLSKIYDDLLQIANIYGDERNYWEFNYRNLKLLLNWYGKSNKEIAREVLDFFRPNSRKAYDSGIDYVIQPIDYPKFYAYFADYDWVVFCWLFGKMKDLPKGFPKYCIDLKQMIDEKADNIDLFELMRLSGYTQGDIEEAYNYSIKKNVILERLPYLKKHPNYPKQTNEHNALADAKWNKELHRFIKSL